VQLHDANGIIFQTQQHLRGKAHTFTIEKLEQSDSHLFGPPSAQASLPQQIDKEPGRQHSPLPAPKMHYQYLVSNPVKRGSVPTP
jgi:hypothetical protein